MLDPNVARVTGIPNSEATHWGISRYDRDKPVRQSYPDASGAHVREWSLEDLNVDVVRERWGEGQYKCHWFRVDPEAPEARDRFTSQGNGVKFKLESEPVASTVPGHAPAAPTINVNPSDPSGMFRMMLEMQEISDRRAERSIQAITSLVGLHPTQAGPPVAVPPEMTERLARLETELAVEKALRAANEKHAAEIAELNKKLAEVDEDEPDTGLSFSPDGGSIWTQLGYGILNAAAKKPELVAAVAGPLMAAMGAAGGPPAAPPQRPPQPRPIQTAPALHGTVASAGAPYQRPPAGTPVQDDGSINSSMPSSPMSPPEPTISVPVVGANGVHRAPAQAPAPAEDAPPSVT